MNLRTLTSRVTGRKTGGPADATHVLYFTPPGCPDYAAWYIVPITDWCSDLPPRDWTFLGQLKAERDAAEELCTSFAAGILGFPVILDRFDYDLPVILDRSNHDLSATSGTTPAYCVIPA